ncbi:uncharacterized protein AMSG_03168 [Thecamonas trahens ATCC 50062]|uniref:BZIP domain-containing protein n=1 Tax=Thecamonas trahens ATCC 50062 TaxID=461836 RepID=A0A0L0D3G8_THETB|nr:hypothetical protein AMSG_03168 [Thecamonas trahens ATCC 50062]KNC46740.1 hypothetical protein AMSG_03168 [Thecamonas trahens ATCC 50062]|eukprot:XP_013760020.1 hypothetical protein AMSG_03168 [Thecamonas trahens ATCC 50062]
MDVSTTSTASQRRRKKRMRRVPDSIKSSEGLGGEEAEAVDRLLRENRELKNKNRLLEFKIQVLTDMLTCERLDSLAREQLLLEQTQQT